MFSGFTGLRTVLFGGIAGVLVGYSVTRILAGLGKAVFVPGYPFALACAVLVPIEIFLALKVWRASHGKTRINSLFAFRVLIMAKSYSFTGVFFCGFSLGIGWHFLLISTAPAPEIRERLLVSLAAAFIMWLGGIISEWLCCLPKDDDAAVGKKNE